MEDIKYIQEIEQEEKIVSFDPDRFLSVLKKLIPWILALLIVAIITSWLVIRYTKPLYESKSVLKLDIKSEASLLGFNSLEEEQSYTDLLSEIELLKSKLFYNKIIDAVDLDLSVYTIGNILVDERYKNSPFEVQYDLKSYDVYDVPFRVEILGSESFLLSYSIHGQDHRDNYSFGQKIDTDLFQFVITKTEHFEQESRNTEFYFIINSRQKLLEYIEKNFSVQPLKLNTNTIEISFKDYNVIKARDLVNAIDTIYLNYSREEKTKANSQKIAFLNQQLETTEDRLSDFEDYFESFIIRNKTTDLQDNLKGTIQLLNALDSQRYNLQVKLNRIQDLEMELDSGRQINLGINDYRILPPEIQQEIEELNELLEKSESILLSYNKNTQVYRLRTNEINSIYNRIYKFIDEYKEDVRAQLNELSVKKAKLEKNFVDLPSKNTEFTKSQRYYTLYEEFYLSLMQKKAEFQLAMAGTVTDFKILSSATMPSEPLKPKKGLIYGIGLVSWIVITFFMLGIGYLSFNRITGLKEVERLTDIPVIGTIPFHSSEKLKNGRLIIEKTEQTAVGEAFRSLRTNMQFIMPRGNTKIISVSSTVSGEGKTFIGLNLASIIAKTGKKVLLVDLDLRKPRLNSVFTDINNQIGISTILIGKNDVKEGINPSGIPNLDVILAGPVPPNPSELIMSEQMDSMLKSLKRRYDLILIDTPPIGIVTDGILVMKKADIQLYVIRAEYSKNQFVRFIEKNNSIHKFPHIYLILNSIRISRGLHYGYGYGSGYYREKKKNLFQRLFQIF